MKQTILIIGGGLGGLFTGALLAKEGFAVTVLEKNRNIGGGLQTFVRDGERFDTGMHMLGGLRKGGSIHKICHYLGILDQLRLLDVDADCMDSLHYFSDNTTYRIAEGRDAFIASLAAHFPHEAEALQRYVDALYALADEVDFFYLRRGDAQLRPHSEQFLWAADELIAHYIADPKLRDVLGYMNPMYGGVAHHTPAYIHALINVLYIDGASRFAGGSDQLATALQGVIEAQGGRIVAGAEVTRIDVAERRITQVETIDGGRYAADRYIAAIHPCTLLTLMDEAALPRSYRNRLQDIPNSYSAFTVYLTLHPESFPYINHTCYCQERYGIVWDYNTYDAAWPQGFMYMTPPAEEQGPYARKLIITAPMPFEAVRRWENTTVGQRGAAYEAWKQRCADKLIDKLARLYPNLRSQIRHIYASSPLTIRDYYAVKEGAMYGYRKDCQNIMLSQLPIFTKIGNLLLTGQNINLHGICGTPLTAVNTAEAIVGEYVLVDKINRSYSDENCR